jgi:oligopeptidase B
MTPWWRSLPIALVFVFAPVPSGSFEQAKPAITSVRAVPPAAEAKPLRSSIHGIERVDDYAWLRDPNWHQVLHDPSALAPMIRAHLEAENRYSEAVLDPLSGLRATLVQELRGRVDPDQSEVPTPDGPYDYWTKFLPGAEQPRIVRTLRSGGPEEVLLDGEALAQGKSYFALGKHRQSPDHRYYAYLVDQTGSENYLLHIRDLTSGRDLPEVTSDVSDFAWSKDGGTLFYVRRDSEHRPLLVYRHTLTTDPANDRLVYEEKDLGFEVSLANIRSGRFVVITSTDENTAEQWLIDAARPESMPALIALREPNVRSWCDDWGDERLVILTNADGADDFKIVTAPISAPTRENWRDLVPHQQGRRIIQMKAFAGYLVRIEREDGSERLVIRRKSDGQQHTVRLAEEAFSLELASIHDFQTPTIRFHYSSPATPRQTFDYNMETRTSVLRKQQKLPSSFNTSSYAVRRLSVPTRDNEYVPVTLLYKRDLPIDGSAPLFIEGYGAYSFAFPASFDANLLSLVDRGFIYAIAHIRGGLEKGERWRNAGRLRNKTNTFTDFIAVTEHLITSGYAAPGRIVARGDSAGGLLMGAIANMRPDLFAGIVARVPFVDTLNTSLDESLPLTIGDFPEWGDPIRDVTDYRSIASYAPYENVAAQPYPHMLVTAGVSDPRVPYWEPAKWVAKVRAMKTNDARILLMTAMSGHFEASGRFATLDEVALMQAFALDVVGLNRNAGAFQLEALPPGPPNIHSNSGRSPESTPRSPR